MMISIQFDESGVLLLSFILFISIAFFKLRKPIIKKIDSEIEIINSELEKALNKKTILERQLDDEQKRRISIKNQEQHILDDCQVELDHIKKSFQDKLSFYEKKRMEQHHASINRLEEVFDNLFMNKVLDTSLLTLRNYFIGKNLKNRQAGKEGIQLIKNYTDTLK